MPVLMFSHPYLLQGQSQTPSPPYCLSFLIPRTGLSSFLIFCSTLYFSRGTYHDLSFIITVLSLILKATITSSTSLSNPAASYLWGRLLLVEIKVI